MERKENFPLCAPPRRLSPQTPGTRMLFLPPQKWRPFCLRFEGVVEDFNYGTLLRLDCRQGYTEENTIFGGFWGGVGRLDLAPAPAPSEKGKLKPRICFLKFFFSLFSY